MMGMRRVFSSAPSLHWQTPLRRQIPAIAFGTGSKWKGHDVTAYVEQAFEAGFSHIDTAQYYRTEQFIGNALRESALNRSEFFITSKWSGIGGPREALNNSLSELGLKQLDLYLIHDPRAVTPETWPEFEKFKKEGLVKSIGVSNYPLEQLKSLIKEAKVVPAVNQILLHPYNYAENKELLEYSAKHGIVIEAYSSLRPITAYPGGPVDKPVSAAAKRLNATPTQVLLAWVRSKGAVIVTTSSRKDHLKEYLDVADLPPLTDEEIAAIDAAGAEGIPSLPFFDWVVFPKVVASFFFNLSMILALVFFLSRFRL
ncbi:hypothetical protein NLI96_g11019 [Meripilus lineatus]|uniref:NADP-dependent oxidoreductase domain-containing protein n=1 Tax=Meripilus lineatus TaxID=2056292 RepID=A0AAD5YDS6_9APHY|nr:hypothetical protein NLI96_g11019 [Physisporinus lineatus]